MFVSFLHEYLVWPVLWQGRNREVLPHPILPYPGDDADEHPLVLGTKVTQIACESSKAVLALSEM